MEKYIGNKNRILKNIGEIVDSMNIHKGVFMDIFAGTNNVGKYFKKKGFRVISNDFNACSYVFGKALIEANQVPKFKRLMTRYKIDNYVDIKSIEKYLSLNSNGHKYIWTEFLNTDRNLIKVFTFLSSLNNLNSVIQKESELKIYPLIFRNYCPSGELSKYRDRFGISGYRMFFTDQHGSYIDALLNLLKFWKIKKIINKNEFYLVLSSLIDAAVLFSNTSGVYEAFYKKWFPNTKQEFRLPIPDLDILHIGLKGKSYCMDANQLISKYRDKVDVLYIDPPYNTRQYDSNYHLLNTIAKFHEIKDIAKFEKGLIGVRGQNKDTSKRSLFSSRKDFKAVMENLIYSANAKNIIVSYFDGDDNLWNQKGNDEGIQIISRILLNPQYFKVGSFKMIKVPRQNFQSRFGKKKTMVNEVLFAGVKK